MVAEKKLNGRMLNDVKGECGNPNSHDAPGEVQYNAEAVVAVVLARDLISKDGYFQLKTKPLNQRKLHSVASLSDDFPFQEGHSMYHLGTGFFIQKDVIVSAAHIFFPGHSTIDFSEIRFVRGLFNDSDFSRIEPSQIYRPIDEGRVLEPGKYRVSESSADWALISVQPEYETSTWELKLKVKFGDVNRNSTLYAIGHGLGLGMKWNVVPAKILSNNTNLPYFECNLPLFVSSSGSPVFDAETHQLVGMLVRGTNQLQITEEQKIIWRKQELADEGEECQRLTPILMALQQDLA